MNIFTHKHLHYSEGEENKLTRVLERKQIRFRRYELCIKFLQTTISNENKPFI